MGFFDRFFGGRREAEPWIVEAVAAARARMGSGDLPSAVEALRPVLLAEPNEPTYLKLAAELARLSSERELAELFGRAADAPEDVQRAFELGSRLLSEEDAELAAAVLSRAADLAPFDAVLRSETAIALARAGRPQAVVETLALHPNLADDPGALFEFAWASLLVGDVDTAAASRQQLAALSAAPRLLDKLGAALGRAAIDHACDPPDARDYYFLEHGGLLIDSSGEGRGRHGALRLDAARISRIVAGAAAALETLWPKPRRITPGSDADLPLAKAVAAAVGGELAAPGAGRTPSGLIVVRDAHTLEDLDPRIYGTGTEVFTFALTLRYDASLARAPDLVGVMARRFEHEDGEVSNAPRHAHAELISFAEARRAHLPPGGRHVHTAYLPDAPLPRP